MTEPEKPECVWTEEVMDRYDVVAKLQPPPQGFREDWPEWASKLFLILMHVSHPGLKLKKGEEWTAKKLGAFLGRQFALDAVMAGEAPLSPQVLQEVDQVLATANPSHAIMEAAAKYEKELEEWRPRFKRFIEETLISARGRPYPEASAFFEAFGRTSIIKPDDFLTERTVGVGEKIAWVMFVLWPAVATLESVAQLHQILFKAAAPKGIVIEYRRVEKLCQRIGLKFKGPGRPKKRTQTNPKSS